MRGTSRHQALTTCLFASFAVLCGIFALLAIAGLFLPGYVQHKLNDGVRQAVVWDEASPNATYHRYERNDLPDDPPDVVKLYMFNVSNLDDVQAGEKPVLQEVGPFAYRKLRTRHDVWFSKDGFVQFKDYNRFQFLPDLSVGDPADYSITTLNIPLIGVMTVIQSMESRWKWLVDMLVKEIATWRNPNYHGVFTQRSAAELLWGYDDALLQRLAKWLPSLQAKVRFQLMKNATSMEATNDRPSIILKTGKQDISEINQFVVWEGVREVTVWNNHSEVVRGTDATQFQPGLSENSTLTVWVGELFRAASLVFSQHVSLHDVDLLRFVPDEAFATPNEEYWQRIRGLANVTAAMAAGANGSSDAIGPPLYLSLPHYCDCDDALTRDVAGVSCDPSRHRLYIDVEPITGVTMRAAKRLMLSSEVTHSVASVIDANVRNVIMPIFWADESSEADAAASASFRHSVYGTIKIINLTKLMPVIAGAALVCCALAAALLLWRLRSGGTESSNADTAHAPAQSSTVEDVEGGTENGAMGVRAPLLPSRP